MMEGIYSMRRVTSMMLVPILPARPVRPLQCGGRCECDAQCGGKCGAVRSYLRWMYVSQSGGASSITTSSTLLISRPRAATSVATRVLNLPDKGKEEGEERGGEIGCGQGPLDSIFRSPLSHTRRAKVWTSPPPHTTHTTATPPSPPTHLTPRPPPRPITASPPLPPPHTQSQPPLVPPLPHTHSLVLKLRKAVGGVGAAGARMRPGFRTRPPTHTPHAKVWTPPHPLTGLESIQGLLSGALRHVAVKAARTHTE